MDRIILYKIPKGGIPERDIPEGTVLAARVPIYGTRDAGRGFWLKLKDEMLARGYELNRILPTVFVLREEDKIVGVMSSNVDDLLYGHLDGYEDKMNDVLDSFSVRERQEAPFRFCGKEVNQDTDYSIKVTAKDNTEKIRPIEVHESGGKKKKLTDKNNAKETTALRSVVASLAWIARQVRPALSYRVSKLQTVAGNGCIKDIRECNKVLEYALSTSDEGLYFTSNFGEWDDCVVTSISDASFANEDEAVKGQTETGRSQQGHVIVLGPQNVANAEKANVHPISWSSTVIKRVCRSTLQAETFAMIRGTEAGARIRAGIVDMRGKLDLKHWEESSAEHMGHCWMTDCDSLFEHLTSSKMNSVENKRLGIDLMALRQLVWERGGERTQYIDHDSGDYPRWIDTSTMVADPLTKAMSAERLDAMLRTGVLDLTPTPESLFIKEKNKVVRKNAKEKKKNTTAHNTPNETTRDAAGPELAPNQESTPTKRRRVLTDVFQ